MEDFEFVVLLTGPHEGDGLSRDCDDGKGGSSPGVAVELGQDNRGQPDLLLEGLGGTHCVLAGHGVSDIDNLGRLEGILDQAKLRHQVFIDMEPSGGVHDERIIAPIPGVGDKVLKGLLGRGHLLPANLVEGQAELAGDHLELVLSGRPFQVERDEKRVFLEGEAPLGQLAAGCRFSGALETDHHKNGRGLAGEAQGFGLLAENGGQFIAEDLDHLLGRSEAIHHFLVQGFGLDLLDELFDDFIIDVGLEEGQTDHPQGLGHVLLGDRAFPPDELQDLLEPGG